MYYTTVVTGGMALGYRAAFACRSVCALTTRGACTTLVPIAVPGWLPEPTAFFANELLLTYQALHITS